MTPAQREYLTAKENLDPNSIPRQERAAIADKYASCPDVDQPFAQRLTEEQVKAYWRAKHLADDWGMAVDAIGDALNRLNDAIRYQASLRRPSGPAYEWMRDKRISLGIMLAEANTHQAAAEQAIPNYWRDV